MTNWSNARPKLDVACVVDLHQSQVQYFSVLWIRIGFRYNIFQCWCRGCTMHIGFRYSIYFSVLWLRIGFNGDQDPDLAFYLNADPDPGSQTNTDPVPCQTLKAQKV